MKRILLSIISVVWLLAVSPAAFAQDCSNWTNGHLVGTYSMSGGGYIDPSKLLPGAAAGTVPTYSVGALALDGKGGGKG